MKYELAKQLKDAGFPQEGKHDCCYQGCCGTEGKGEICFPTLSELIEACGEKFASLIKRIDLWDAHSHTDAYKEHLGSTPEEAVAKLWLELNKK